MSINSDGGSRGVAPPKPLFQSSWLALFLLLRQELESFRGEAANDSDAAGKKPKHRVN
ncbi:MAG: hypothetical protein AAGH19_12165 [Pseudomonadota bacterium]